MFFTVTVLHAQEVKVYAALETGTYAVKYSESGPAGALSAKKSGMLAGMVKVGLDYNDYVGGEIRLGTVQAGSVSFPVGTLGSATAFGVKIQPSLFISYLGKVHYPVSQSFEVYALFGGTAAKFNIKPTGTGVMLSTRAIKTGLSYGIGAEYKPRPLFSVGLEWMQYWTDVTMALSGGAKSSASFGGLGLSFRRSFE